MKIVTFDYSITSPAMTIFAEGKFKCYNITSQKKCQYFFSKDEFEITGIQYPLWNNSQERYDSLSETFLEILRNDKVFEEKNIHFGIEDYSFGSKGKVFHIAENTEIIKYKIWKETRKEILAIPPKTIKKIFSKNGNSNKIDMAETFMQKYNFYMHDLIGSKIDGPACDLIDSIALNQVLQKIISSEITLDEIFNKKPAKASAKRSLKS